ncbi:MAG: hypothetical protein SFX18_13385 [Pirellulales bacterium]|nr:hypothetical protein [Pirellulales bacterium]
MTRWELGQHANLAITKMSWPTSCGPRKMRHASEVGQLAKYMANIVNLANIVVIGKLPKLTGAGMPTRTKKRRRREQQSDRQRELWPVELDARQVAQVTFDLPGVRGPETEAERAGVRAFLAEAREYAQLPPDPDALPF